ncbi:MAG TPA: glutathione S-transferase N-terminal domain-containing protein [Parvularculaceae bacterium]|nr:glutathione S-transferase N-terminal domain-containing protein [Parvularculaceae bacterium]
MTSPIAFYYWPTPNGWKISIYLEETGLPYKVDFVNILAGAQFEPEFLKISPNNRVPAIVDPDGPDGKPISVFESGAILQYLGRKTGKLYPTDERARVEVDEWLMWQMGGIGPMLGQLHHFANYAPEKIDYAITRYKNEAHRLYGVLDKRLKGRDYVAGDYSIADIAIFSWTWFWARHQVGEEEFPDFKRWVKKISERPAVQRGLALGADRRGEIAQNEQARKVLFGQRAR